MRIPWYLGNPSANNFWPVGIVLMALWSAVWTGLALWHAAKRDEKGWFILFCVVHTLGILEIIYLLVVVKIKIFSAKSPSRRQKK